VISRWASLEAIKSFGAKPERAVIVRRQAILSEFDDFATLRTLWRRPIGHDVPLEDGSISKACSTANFCRHIAQPG
jgi:hypothetical protein